MNGEVPEGSVHLKNTKHEMFAQNLSRGVSQTESYRRTIGRDDITDGTARQNGMRTSRLPSVVARVEWLRKDALDRQERGPETITKSALLDLMAEVTIAFTLAVDALELNHGSPRAIASLRAELVTHVGRLHRMAPPKTTQVALGAPDHITDGLERMTLCHCAA